VQTCALPIFSLDSSAARDLLTNWINSTANASQKSISVFIDTTFAESNPNVEVSRDAFGDQFNTFVRLYKIATLNHAFGLTPPQLQWLFDFGPSNGWLN